MIGPIKKYFIKRCNLKRKSKPYIYFSPNLWGTNVFFSGTTREVKLFYTEELYAAPDLFLFEQLFSVKCKIVNLENEDRKESQNISNKLS